MATFKYFSTDGAELASPHCIRNEQFAAKFPGVKGVRVDSFSRWVGSVAGEIRPVVRVIEFKSNPSLHKCDGRCLHAKGRTCECSCGGANHGAGG
jgi:hypothetical protein